MTALLIKKPNSNTAPMNYLTLGKFFSFFLILGHTIYLDAVSLLPNQGSNLCLLQWKGGVSAAGPSGKSLTLGKFMVAWLSADSQSSVGRSEHSGIRLLDLAVAQFFRLGQMTELPRACRPYVQNMDGDDGSYLFCRSEDYMR